jgi:hypothetical protein
MTGDDLPKEDGAVEAPVAQDSESNRGNRPSGAPSKGVATLRIVLISMVCTLAVLALGAMVKSYLTNPDATGSGGAATPLAAANAPASSAQADELKAAFAVAYPSAQAETAAGALLLFTPQALIPIGDQTFALLATGTAVSDIDSCHACSGALRITYLVRTAFGESRLELPSERLEWDIPGNDFGAAPEWKAKQIDGKPVVEVSTGGMTQGCTYSAKEVYQLDERTLTYLPELTEKVEC